MIPFEFTVEGPPVSHQATNKTRLAAWRAQVRAAAAARWTDDPPSTDCLEIIITYYHDRPAIRMDNDNMVKPIQDALAGLVYANDRQITDTKLRKTALDGSFRIRGVSIVLAHAFSDGREFLHIQVKAQPDHSELLT